MLLAVDVGNTQTVFGLYDGGELTEHWRIATERHRSGDELGAQYKSFLDLGRVDGISLASSVPQLSRSYQEFARRYTDAELLELGPGVPTGLRTPSPRPNATGRRASWSTSGRRRISTSCRRLGNTWAVCSRRGSRSRWMRSSSVRRACARSTSSSRRV